MGHDAYICYDNTNRDVCDEICHIFDENSISYWVKSRVSSKNSVDELVNAIESAKCFILILSKDSNNSNQIITEVDFAFSREIPILVLKIDDLKLKGNLEFLLANQKILSLFPNPEKQLEKLVKKTCEIIGKPASNVKIDSKSLKRLEKYNPQRKENNIKKYVMIAVPIAVALILIYFFVIVPTGQHTTEDGVFSMNITDVDVSGGNGNYKYTVHGESYNMPSDSEKYYMNIQFFDKKANMVYEINSTADEFKSGVIGSCELPNDNVTHIGFKLMDLNNKILSQETYVIA